MASEGRAAAPAQASTAASPPLFLAPTASATAPSSPSSLHLISLPPHERSSRHRLLAAVDRASSRISSAHVACRIGDEAHEAPSGLRCWPFSRSLPPLAISRLARASPPSPPSPPRLISRSSSRASRRWLHGRRCRTNRRSSRWCSSRSSSRRRCRCRGARSSRHARLILCACVWRRVCVRRRHQLLASSI